LLSPPGRAEAFRLKLRGGGYLSKLPLPSCADGCRSASRSNNCSACANHAGCDIPRQRRCLEEARPFALLSSDYGKLKAEVNNSTKALGAEQAAARKAGRKPATCMPNNISIGTDEFLNHFRSLPRAQQGGSVKAALLSFVSKKYPCPS
jgi:hypothetical protein